MKFKEYQTEAVEKLLERTTNLLRQEGNKKMVFQSPTGSGKTVMMAELLKQLADSNTRRPLAFIWIAPLQLHEQSHAKLDKYYKHSMALDCVYFYDLTDVQIGMNQVLFLNWASINKKNKNNIVRENERGLYLANVVQNTAEDGQDIVLVIDESHHHANSKMSKKLIADIAPKLTIEVSATPNLLASPDDKYTVPPEHVVQEGMIKKSVILNEGFKNLPADGGIDSELAKETSVFVLERALNKRKELAHAFDNAAADVNPLLCIQLPNDKTEQDGHLKKSIMEMLKDHDITVKNGKLAIYLADDKKNRDNISRNDNDAEVLIFKQAIALGWDCPRAHILALFREWHDPTFSVQTLGRIMRMPEPEKGHYNDNTLNRAYVYTNMPNVVIGKGVSGGYISVYTSRLIDDYEPVKLPSVHRLRQREMTRLSPEFIKLFLSAAKNYKLKEQLKKKRQKVQTTLIADYESENIDELTGEPIEGDRQVDVSNESDLQRLFNYFVRKNLSPYYPEDRSINRVKEAIYAFYGTQMNMDFAEYFGRIIDITLSESNRPHFERVLDDAKQLYKEATAKRKEPLRETEQWELPETIDYSNNYIARKVKKSAMNPFYAAKNEPETEKAFIKYLDAASEVKWWYKNGVGESIYFAVPYTEDGEQKPFYADFIVRFNDGTIGIYDTKKGFTLAESKGKSDGLQQYINEENKRRKDNKLTGGIITPADKENSRWKIYTGKGENIAKQNAPGWDWLDF